MTYLRSILLTPLLVIACFNDQVHAQAKNDELKWYTDINEVCQVSAKEKKPVFAFFTGSDWCGWCHKLQAAVLNKPGFKAWAKKNVVLMELDFPRNKKLPDAIAGQNSSLQRFFQVQGYPTVWLFTIAKDTGQQFQINALGSLGYPTAQPGQEEVTFIETANGILKKKPQ